MSLCHLVGEDVMKSHTKITYTKPRQLPLFEEEDDGHLRQYHRPE